MDREASLNVYGFAILAAFEVDNTRDNRVCRAAVEMKDPGKAAFKIFTFTTTIE